MQLKLLNYTSEVSAEKSISEIEQLLIRAGVSKIAKDYLSDGSITAFVFSIELEHGPVLFRLPCNVDSVYTILMAEYKRPRRGTAKAVREQAKRVAWRILRDWIQVQISMIRLGQVKPQQIFLPYAYNPRTNKTLFEAMESQDFQFVLESGATL